MIMTETIIHVQLQSVEIIFQAVALLDLVTPPEQKNWAPPPLPPKKYKILQNNK